MKIAAFMIGLLGCAIGIYTAQIEQTGEVAGIPWMTYGLSFIGAAGALWIPVKPRWGAWICLLSAALGVISALMLWEGAGSFFLVSAILGFAGGPRRAADGRDGASENPTADDQ
ncbi:hypothetical protein [Ferviditalea candida]|uniref:Uncharacterized protein n=1 Tax=Ferviditalea candida TaxID=3108399 RepID=A0ABU5ZHQ0_9BACL|nr:hypothetical protein [Paenibacillaceae bacterium T2]